MDLTINDEFDCARLTKGTQIRQDGGVDGDAFALRRGINRSWMMKPIVACMVSNTTTR